MSPFADADRLTDRAIEAAKAAAAVLIDGKKTAEGGLRTAEWEGGRDVKLAADKAAEAVVAKALGDGADLPILSEEAGWIGRPPDADTPYWCVDPLDGTFNYWRGIPGTAVSIALCRAGVSQLGVVLDLESGAVWHGGPGLGAFCDGTAVAVAATEDPAAGVLATGFPHLADLSDAGLRPLAERAQRWKKIRMLGTATLAAVWVADGRLDAYAEAGARWWDVAAAFAIVAGAGGSVRATPVAGGPFDPMAPLDVAAAATPALMAALGGGDRPGVH